MRVVVGVLGLMIVFVLTVLHLYIVSFCVMMVLLVVSFVRVFVDVFCLYLVLQFFYFFLVPGQPRKPHDSRTVVGGFRCLE